MSIGCYRGNCTAITKAIATQLVYVSQTTITVSERTLERFKSLKAELDDVQDAPDHTNESFLQSLMDTWEAADDGYYSDPSPEEIAEQLKNEISMSNEPAVEVDVDRIMNRIDDLENSIPRKTAEELR